MIFTCERAGSGLQGASAVALALGLALAGLLTTGCGGGSDSPDGGDAGDGSVDDAGDSGTTPCDGEWCEEGHLCCTGGNGSSLCTDVLSDDLHCGACGQPCGADERCEEGLCVCPVASGPSERCRGEQVCCPNVGCSIVNRDPLNCGSCGAPCGQGEGCTDGHCTCAREVADEGPVCAPGQACCGAPLVCRLVDDPQCACGDSICGPGDSCCSIGGVETCISTTTDSEHCGGCGRVCADGERCETGRCECLAGLADCDFDESNGCETTIQSEPMHCGGCGDACGAAEQCVLGECSCLLGWGDCNLESSDGCEALLATDEAHCGLCDNACAANQECIGGSCICVAGFADCNALTADGCEVDLGTDLTACGVCGNTCGDNQECVGGDCLCVEGFADCNRTPTDGCEAHLSDDLGHCGLCDQVCVANQECVDGSCRCVSGYGDCNGRSRDGCEANLVTDMDNCGVCERVCTAHAPCAAGSCGCGFGYGDCNGDPDDDCEVDLSSDPAHCGACPTACRAGQTCRGGRCECIFGLADCNERADDGCEVDLDTDASHCASCGRPCSPNQTCVGGVCVCDEGFDDCNRSSSDGCEAELATDSDHCSECGAACGEGMVCNEGICECATSFADCDSNPDNCEVDHRVNPYHCGACGTRCHSTRICFESECVCAPERADCNGLPGDRCEAYLPTSLTHCGVCGNVCALTEICVRGSCVPALNDLVVTELTTGGPVVAANDVLRVNNTAQNIGTDICSVNARLGIYLSNDRTITTDDTLIHSRDIGILEPLTAVPEIASVTIPGETEPGFYFIGAIVDDTEVQRELDETNNIRLGPAVEVIRDVDLIMTNVIPALASVDVGSDVDITNTIRNIGTTITSTNEVQVAIYLSADRVITTDDLELAEYTREALISGESATTITGVTIPRSAEPGTYYIGAIADYADLQPESDETNNALASAAITLVRDVDLVPIMASTGVVTAARGAAIRITMAIQNSGSTATTADSFASGIFLSRDSRITTADTRIHSRSLANLGPGEIYSVTPSVVIPADTTPGSYFIGVIADYDHAQPETNETNNALSGSRIDVE